MYCRSLTEKKSRSLSLVPFLARYRSLSLSLTGLIETQLKLTLSHRASHENYFHMCVILLRFINLDFLHHHD